MAKAPKQEQIGMVLLKVARVGVVMSGCGMIRAKSRVSVRSARVRIGATEEAIDYSFSVADVFSKI